MPHSRNWIGGSLSESKLLFASVFEDVIVKWFKNPILEHASSVLFKSIAFRIQSLEVNFYYSNI